MGTWASEVEPSEPVLVEQCRLTQVRQQLLVVVEEVLNDVAAADAAFPSGHRNQAVGA